MNIHHKMVTHGLLVYMPCGLGEVQATDTCVFISSAGQVETLLQVATECYKENILIDFYHRDN